VRTHAAPALAVPQPVDALVMHDGDEPGREAPLGRLDVKLQPGKIIDAESRARLGEQLHDVVAVEYGAANRRKNEASISRDE